MWSLIKESYCGGGRAQQNSWLRSVLQSAPSSHNVMDACRSLSCKWHRWNRWDQRVISISYTCPWPLSAQEQTSKWLEQKWPLYLYTTLSISGKTCFELLRSPKIVHVTVTSHRKEFKAAHFTFFLIYSKAFYVTFVCRRNTSAPYRVCQSGINNVMLIVRHHSRLSTSHASHSK